MRHLPLIIRLALALVVFAGAFSPAAAGSEPYRTGFVRWRAADEGFAGWTLNGAQRTSGHALELDPASAQPGSDPYAPGAYYGGNFYNGGSFSVGEATSPETDADFNFAEAIVSWNADTPPGTWVETQLSVRFGTRWSKWYNMGIWAADTATVQRHSVRLQGDGDGYVAVDTFVLSNKKAQPDAFQVKMRLFSADGSAVPTVRNVSVAYSTTVPKKVKGPASEPVLKNLLVDVPQCSQMVYPDGGEVWCSPTSTSMILGFWTKDTGPCSPRVHAAVAGVFDWVYDGHGNWPFNTAYGATARAKDDPENLEGYVARFTSLAQLEPWIAAGVPVAISIAWGNGELTGAPISSSNGHLMVVVGFDANGDPIVNDPAAATDSEVRRTYLRSEFEPLWLSASGGTTYLIYPPSVQAPALP